LQTAHLELFLSPSGNDKSVQNNLKKLLTVCPPYGNVVSHTVTKKQKHMRTKSILAAAAIIAAGAASSQAQSNVYSLNVVGYVNTVVEGGGSYNLLCNPLNNTTANYNTNLFTGAIQQDGANILKWDVNTFDFQTTVPTYGTFANKWDIAVPLPVGEGFFYVNPGNTFTNTFVGEVVQGAFARPVVGSGSYNAIGSSAPIGGSFTNALGGLAPTDGDNVLAWDVVAFDFQTTVPTYGTFLNKWDITSLNVGVGAGLFYVRQGADATWTRNFTVQ
jgi:hypothetical protein